MSTQEQSKESKSKTEIQVCKRLAKLLELDKATVTGADIVAAVEKLKENYNNLLKEGASKKRAGDDVSDQPPQKWSKQNPHPDAGKYTSGSVTFTPDGEMVYGRYNWEGMLIGMNDPEYYDHYPNVDGPVPGSKPTPVRMEVASSLSRVSGKRFESKWPCYLSPKFTNLADRLEFSKDLSTNSCFQNVPFELGFEFKSVNKSGLESTLVVIAFVNKRTQLENTKVLVCNKAFLLTDYEATADDVKTYSLSKIVRETFPRPIYIQFFYENFVIRHLKAVGMTLEESASSIQIRKGRLASTHEWNIIEINTRNKKTPLKMMASSVNGQQLPSNFPLESLSVENFRKLLEEKRAYQVKEDSASYVPTKIH